ALRDFGDVRAGDIGGYIERETNLSHDGNAWVRDNAQVYGNARVFGDARVYGDARVHDHAWVCGNAQVHSGASLCWISDVGSENGTLTAFTAQTGITVTRGCFLGTLEEFEAVVRETYGDSRTAREYALLIEFIR